MNSRKLLPNTQKSAPEQKGKRKVVILGSTGSIGRSTLDVIGQFPERFELLAIAANSQVDLFNRQIELYRPQFAALADRSCSKKVKGAEGTRLSFGEEAVTGLAELDDADIVVAAVVGMAGLPGVLAALEKGKTVALANKESLVAGGPFVQAAIEAGGGRLIPVDSEHSAIFQALGREFEEDLQSLILTASGGPLRETPIEEFPLVSPENAIAHPRWSMGKKISVDSATLMNKALEVIEAHWLFRVPESQIQVVVHPQSIIHSMVEFVDGSILAQLSVPDMKGAIAYALSFGFGRLPSVMERTNFFELGRFDFEEVDASRFPSIELARSVIREGGAGSLVLNVVNEEAVSAFLSGGIQFDQIFKVCIEALESGIPEFPTTVEALYALEQEIRIHVRERISII